MAFGGAGPLHACEAAERLDIPRVLIPRTPGVLCALGLLIADVAVDYSQSVMMLATPESVGRFGSDTTGTAQAGADRIAARRKSNEQGHALLPSQSICVYLGQAYELNLPFSASLVEDFHDLHEVTYGHALRTRKVEIVNLRVQGTGIVEKPEIEYQELRANVALPFAQKESPLGAMIKLFHRVALNAGDTFTGEALIFQMDSTTYVPSGWQAAVDGLHEHRNAARLKR